VSQLTKISFIRHGQVHNPDGIIYGRIPRFSLDKRGTEDARMAAEFLRNTPLTALYSSPLLRARQTALALRHHHRNLQVQISSLLIEVLTAFEGRRERDLTAEEMDFYSNTAQPWEQPADILARTQKFIGKVRKKHPGSHTAAVTHGDIIVFLSLWAQGIEASAENKLRLVATGACSEYPATGSVTTLSYASEDDREVPSLEYTNTRTSCKE